MRFADSNRAGEEEEARSRPIGFSRGLQDGLCRKIERMVRKPTSHDRNYQKCREGCEISNADLEERENFEEGRNVEREAKRRRAWTTPRRSNHAKVTLDVLLID